MSSATAAARFFFFFCYCFFLLPSFIPDNHDLVLKTRFFSGIASYIFIKPNLAVWRRNSLTDEENVCYQTKHRIALSMLDFF